MADGSKDDNLILDTDGHLEGFESPANVAENGASFA